ncbi:MAG: hypothetical protein CVU05_05770 [Bacteroidetes bacterium HGW-Bacteroidetes-21]|nr:MAG: hypothetical protein CVU05_05770 [Bacteroidetes bacterium HGW-Bacteroidetes-21]
MIKTMKNVTFLLAMILMFTSSVVNSQEKRPFMADEFLLQQKVAENPVLIDQYLYYEKGMQMLINAMDEEMLTKTDTLINGRRIIPVVVHVIHRYGPENISDAQILDAIEKLNIDYNLQNADTSETFPLFKPRAANNQIEFRLATIDPDGNCTNGIVRHFDTQTDYAYFATMKEYHWPTDKYMNVFTVSFIYPEGMSLPDGAFIGGMSPFPPSNTLSQALTGGDADIDGVLIRHDGVGSIGTAENMAGMPINSLNRTFTHESGHYFNLYHPFQNLMFGLLPASSGCHTFLAPNGDEVSDTPPVAVASQNTSLACITPGVNNTCTETPEEPDMVENYMDYQFGYCTNIFTVGQKARIDATLLGDRRNLWSVENLIATGVLDISTPVVCAPKSDFNTTSTAICAGTTITFNDRSFNGVPTDYEWTFEGGTPATSNVAAPAVTFDTPGVYSVSLKVANSYGSDSISKQSYIYVYDPTAIATAPIYEGFENGLNGDWAYYNEEGNAWEWFTPNAFEGVRCMRISNFTGNTANSIDAISTPGYDLTTLNTNRTLRLKFSYAYAGKITAGTILSEADTAYDKFKILASTDCGKTWAIKWTRSGAQLETASPVETEFVPSDVSQWKTDSISIHTYLAAGATNLRLRFEFTGNGGNSFYLDNIVMDNYTLSAEEFFLDELQFSIFPNPARDMSQVSFSLPENGHVKMEVKDVLGRHVLTLSDQNYLAGQQNIDIPMSQLSGKGVYFIQMTYADYTYTTKLVVE